MTCREFVEFLNAYLNGELTPPERAEFERHLAVCPACIHYLRGYQHTVVLSKTALAAEKLPEDAPDELVEAILAAKRRGT